jgi:hypothetical protein
MTSLTRFFSRYKVTANPVFIERRIELVALVLTVVLIVQVLYGALRLSVLSEPESIAPALDVMIDSEPLAIELVSAELSEELRARPLFWPSRRVRVDNTESASVEQKTPAPETEIDKLKLVGVFGAGESGGIIALVEGKKRRILVGEVVEGWSLDSVTRNEAVFADESRRKTLILKPQEIVATSATSGNSGAVPGAAPAADKDKTAKPPRGLGFGGRANK